MDTVCTYMENYETVLRSWIFGERKGERRVTENLSKFPVKWDQNVEGCMIGGLNLTTQRGCGRRGGWV